MIEQRNRTIDLTIAAEVAGLICVLVAGFALANLAGLLLAVGVCLLYEAR